MGSLRTIVIAGAGPAAASAAAELRSGGFDGRILLVGDEAAVPYERPPLSKEYLLGKRERAELPILPPDWYDQHAVDLALGTRIERIDAGEGTVSLSGGERIGYDQLLLATGGRPRRLRGVEGDRVVYLRTLAEAEALAERLRNREPLVVLGGGFIGCEIAATARQLGAEVTVVEMAPVPLQAALGDRFGALIAEIHREAGVDLRTGERVLEVTGSADGVVVTTDRERIACGLVLVAVGLVPNTELAAEAGIPCENGILVDERCRSVVPGVFAAGDVAAHRHPLFGRHLRVEHHDNALKQGAAAARSMLGADDPYDDPHWFWSDQYSYNLQSVGDPRGREQVVIRGSLEDRSFSAFSLAAGRVRAVFAMNRGRDVQAGRRLIAAGVTVDPARLRDDSFNLRRLLR
jgi:3-phenylpropionate/trans-cinnamate dioxygenase ferredoxin reductase subunit